MLCRYFDFDAPDAAALAHAEVLDTARTLSYGTITQQIFQLLASFLNKSAHPGSPSLRAFSHAHICLPKPAPKPEPSQRA